MAKLNYWSVANSANNNEKGYLSGVRLSSQTGKRRPAGCNGSTGLPCNLHRAMDLLQNGFVILWLHSSSSAGTACAKEAKKQHDEDEFFEAWHLGRCFFPGGRMQPSRGPRKHRDERAGYQ